MGGIVDELRKKGVAYTRLEFTGDGCRELLDEFEAKDADIRALAEALELTVQLAMLSDAADEAVDGIAGKARAALRRPGVRKAMGR